MRKHSDLPITFASWYQCNRLDEISSGIEDLVGFSETISRGEEFNICKRLGYDILSGSNVTEADAYRAGKREYDKICRREAALRKWREERQAREDTEALDGCLKGLFTLFIGVPVILALVVAGVMGLAWLMRTIFFGACDAVSGLYSLICSNIFFIALFLIPSTIIFVGHKIESKKKQNKHIK